MKKSKKEKFSFYSGKAVWKQKPITEWEIRCWVNDSRGLIPYLFGYSIPNFITDFFKISSRL